MSANSHLPIAIPEAEIAEFCRRNHVSRLALFGSALRANDFRPDSDIDMLIEFEPGHALGLAFFALEEELERVLGRTVDLHTADDLSRYFRAQIIEESETLYERKAQRRERAGSAH